MALFLVAASTAGAQIVSDMTPVTIREAIAMGTKAKDLGWYRIQEKARFTWPPLIALYTTPFLRVALAANNAKKHYKVFTEADVTHEMLAPEIQVLVPSQWADGGAIANVETIVLLPHNSKDASQAIHPAQTKDPPEEYKDIPGFPGGGKSLIAIFPIAVWKEGNDVRVVFDRAIPGAMGPKALGGCTDCKARLYLDKVR